MGVPPNHPSHGWSWISLETTSVTPGDPPFQETFIWCGPSFPISQHSHSIETWGKFGHLILGNPVIWTSSIISLFHISWNHHCELHLIPLNHNFSPQLLVGALDPSENILVNWDTRTTPAALVLLLFHADGKRVPEMQIRTAPNSARCSAGRWFRRDFYG